MGEGSVSKGVEWRVARCVRCYVGCAALNFRRCAEGHAACVATFSHQEFFVISICIYRAAIFSCSRCRAVAPVAAVATLSTAAAAAGTAVVAAGTAVVAAVVAVSLLLFFGVTRLLLVSSTIISTAPSVSVLRFPSAWCPTLLYLFVFVYYSYTYSLQL